MKLVILAVLIIACAGCRKSSSVDEEQNTAFSDPVAENSTETVNGVTDTDGDSNDPLGTNVETGDELHPPTPLNTDTDGRPESEQTTESSPPEGTDTETGDEWFTDTDGTPEPPLPTDSSFDSESDSYLESESETVTETSLDGGIETDGDCLVGDFDLVTAEDREALDTVTCITGNLNIVAAQVEDITLESLESIGLNLNVNGNETLASLHLPGLMQVTDISFSSNEELVASIEGIESADGIYISGNQFISVDLSALKRAMRIFLPGNGDGIVVNFESLLSVDENLDASGGNGFETLAFPSLQHVGGDVGFAGQSSATTIDLRNLVSATNVNVAGNAVIKTLLISSLETTGDLVIAGNGGLGEVNLAALTNIKENLEIVANPMLPLLDIPLLTSVAGTLKIRGNGSLNCDADALLLAITVGGDATICENLPDSACGENACPDLI